MFMVCFESPFYDDDIQPEIQVPPPDQWAKHEQPARTFKKNMFQGQHIIIQLKSGDID